MTEEKKSKSRESYHHGDLRAQLIKATQELVETVGPDQFSVSEACRVAGVSTAAPYKHFADKQAMLDAVAKEGLLRLRGKMKASLDAHSPGSIDRIVALGQSYVQFALSEPGVFRLVFGFKEGDNANEEMTEIGLSTFAVVQEEAALYNNSEHIRPEDMQRAFLLWSFVHGLAFLYIDNKISNMALSINQEAVLRDVAQRVMS